LGWFFLDEVAVLEPGQHGDYLAREEVGEQDEHCGDGDEEQDEVVVGDALDLVLLVESQWNLLSAVDESVVLVLVTAWESAVALLHWHLQAQLADDVEIDVLTAGEQLLQLLFLNRDILTSMTLDWYSVSVDFWREGENKGMIWTLGESVEHCDEKSMSSVALEIYRIYLMSLTLAFVGLLCCSGWYSIDISLNFEEYRRSPLENLMYPRPLSAS
jgi:hypothetical protein